MLLSVTCLCLVAESAALVAAAGPMDEVVVTATRRETSRTEIPEAVSVVGADRVQDKQLVTDALADAVGGYVQQTTPGQGAAIIRGLKGSAVLHLVDGMRLNNAIFRSAPTQYFAFLPTTATERIEVVRGTPASLYGSDAVGGVVQLVTRRPEFDKGVTLAAGDLYAAWASADEAARIAGTVDVGNSDWWASFSGEYLDTSNRTVGGGETIGPSGYTARAARVALGLTPDDETSWVFDLHYYEQPKTPRVDELVPGFGQTEPSSSEFFFQPNRRIYANARRERSDGLAGLDWTWSFAWQRIDDDRVSRGLNAPDRRREQNASDLFGLLGTAGRSSDTGSWLAGVEFYYDTVSSARIGEDVATGATVPLAPRFPDGSEVLTGSVFGTLSRNVGERVTTTAGLRFSEVEVRLPETAVTPKTTLRTGDFAGDVGLIVAFADDWQWIANAGFGFRAPNVFDLGTLGTRPGNRFNIPNTTLDSEQVVQLDTGVRYSGDRLQLELVGYVLRYDDRITSVSTGDVTPGGRDVVQSVNAARSDIAGIEFGSIVALSDTLSLRAEATWTRGEQRVEGEAEEPADRIPPLSGSLALSWDGGRAWRAEGWLRFADRQDRLSARDVRDTRINPAGTPGWGSAGGRLSWLPNAWTLSLAIDNVFDKRYRVHGSGIDAAGLDVSIGVRRRF